MKVFSCLMIKTIILTFTCTISLAQSNSNRAAGTENFKILTSSNKVTATEKIVVMPTSRVGFSNPTTPFKETGGRDQDVCYPSAYNGHSMREKQANVGWKIVTLENEYIRVEFAPELGGMIWSIYDKVHREDILHSPGKVTPVVAGFGGTYTPGGVELDYPYAHAIMNTWPRKTEFRENKDGSATYVVSEWERNGRTEWSMEFTLRPGESRIRQDVTLYNRSKMPASFVYWGNARIPATADTRWIYPESMASEHDGANSFTWPIFRGVDLSLLINDPEVIGMYFLEPRYNFFGLTNIKTTSGMVHYANHHDVPGKKLWNWGRLPKDDRNTKWDAFWEGSVWEFESHFFGYDYAEVQSGRMVNQDHLEWLNPDESILWNEGWSPIFGLTDVNEVTEDAAFQLLEKENKLMIYSFTKANDVKLYFYVDGKQVNEMNLTLKTSGLQEIDLKKISGDKMDDLEIRVVKAGQRSGNISSKKRCEQKKSSELREVPILREHSTESLAIRAEFDHKLLNREEALNGYLKALELDSINYKAHVGLAKLLFYQGNFSDARKHLESAVKSYKWEAEAYLLLAEIDQLEGNPDAAEDNAYLARYYGAKSRGNIKLGEIFISRGEFVKAKDFLNEALLNNARSLRTYTLLALCERKLGNKKQALAQLDKTPAGALKDILWYSEAFLAGRINGNQLAHELFNDEWRYLEISLDYMNLGANQEALQFADLGIGLHRDKGWVLDKLYNPDRMWNFTRKRETPFFYLVKGAIAQREGRSADAAQLFKEGDYFENYVNFNQPEMIPVMQSAIQAGNGYACFYLGNFYYHGRNYAQAKKLWDQATVNHPDNPQILRNLAVFEEFQNTDLDKSVALFKRALALDPNDVFIRHQLILAEKTKGTNPDDILAIYLQAPKEQQYSYLFNNGLIREFKRAGKWKEAEEYLKKVDRRYSEDIKTWYDFCVSYAQHLVNNSKPAEALEWVEKSGTTPENLSNLPAPVQYFFRQREFYIAALAYKLKGDALKSKEYFRKVIGEPADFMFNETHEPGIVHMRFYMALAMKELGMDEAARAILVGINRYRLGKGLVVLYLENSELDRWHTRDPLLEFVPNIERE